MSRSKRNDERPVEERHEQLMHRIMRRYEQLDEELAVLEAKLPQLDDEAEVPARSPKPR
mgnify:CR=1 FL=1